ncbi:MAG: hypothetical protein HYZ65_10085 [Burkholderiales bacterium]|nr:hypothetical protein [Burkholderiales bacterium]
MNDTLSFVKSLWGSMQVPGIVAPPMSVDELDKKIQELKTVESWLTVNMNMLHGTIQALEVQRATIAALNSLGESFARHAAATAEPAAGHAGWPMPPAATKKEEVAQAQPAQPAAAEPPATVAPENNSAFVNPAAWWNLLQDQFKQAVSQAMEGEPAMKEAPAAGTVKAANGTAAQQTGKPAVKKTATKASQKTAVPRKRAASKV